MRLQESVGEVLWPATCRRTDWMVPSALNGEESMRHQEIKGRPTLEALDRHSCITSGEDAVCQQQSALPLT